ncbi:MAG: FHA domain-containing protein [Planctomycetia bacterium]|nr:FHA domain-containing protein [Planctomycetia bacterium]
MKVQLKVVSGSKAGQLITINLPQFIIGRAEDCHLKPRSELISRYHCAILSEEGYVAIRDLGSKNGVFLNGHRVAIEEELKNGDKLIIGPLEFEIVLTVALKGETKPKVESIQEVVARAVERDTMSTSKETRATEKSSEEGDFTDWLMDDNSDIPDETKTLQNADDDALFGLQYKQPEDEEAPEEKSKTGEVKKQPAGSASDSSSSDAAANLLKNFFKGGR